MTTPEPVDFLTISFPDGRAWIRLDQLADGRVMCCLCFDYCTRDQLSTDPADGQLTDICKPCRTEEEQPHA